MKCPNCEEYIRVIDTFDAEFFGNTYEVKVEGICQNCHKTWTWTEFYTYSHATKPEEVTEEDIPDDVDETDYNPYTGYDEYEDYPITFDGEDYL